MATQNVKVSVIVPVYNVENYLGQCLDSITNQTLRDIEIICVDDGSTDNSLAILKQYAATDKRFTILSHPNMGVGHSRNQAIEMAHGKFLAFMDPDDYYPELDTLEKMYTAALNNKVSICGGGLIIYNQNKNEEINCKDWPNYFDNDSYIPYSEFQYDYGFQRYIYSAKLIKDNNIKFPNYRRFQDPIFMIRAMIASGGFYALKDYVYGYRSTHQTINWTEEKCLHLLNGLYDDLMIAASHNLSALYTRTMHRIQSEYKAQWTLFDTPDIQTIKQKIMTLCLQHSEKHMPTLPSKPKVSIIMPIYNPGEYLREALDSVINQTLHDIEIICVNDGSTDNSLDIIKEYAAHDGRIRYIDKPNAGYGHTMNCGIDAARGEYIGIVEPDDFIKPDMYEALYNKGIEHNADIIKADYYTFNGSAGNYKFKRMRIINDESCYNTVLSPKTNDTILTDLTLNPAGIFRRDFLNKYKIRHNETPGAAHQDNGFWIQTMYLAECVYFLDRHFYCYRQDNPNQSIHSKKNVYAIINEYRFAEAHIKSPLQNKRIKTLYIRKKYNDIIWHMQSRTLPECWPEYIQIASTEFKQYNLSKDADLTYFPEPVYKQLLILVKNPAKYLATLSSAREKATLQKRYYLFGFIPLLKIEETL